MRQPRAETAQGKHGEGDQRLGRLESEGAASDETELGVQAFDGGVGQTVGEGGLDQGGVLADRSGELDEGLERAATSPVESVLEQLNGLLQGQLEDQAELLLEEVRTVQGVVQLGDPGQACPLALGC